MGLDLIEVSPTAAPPVCRIMDYGKFKYEQAKREKDAHRKSKQAELALIRVRPNIDEHDLGVKLRNARKFLEDGDKVRVFVVFRSREFTHPEFGHKLLRAFTEGLTDVANIEKSPGMEGRQMTLVLSPKPKAVLKPTKAETSDKPARPESLDKPARPKPVKPEPVKSEPVETPVNPAETPVNVEPAENAPD